MTRHLTVDDLAERWRTTPKAVHNQRHRGELPPAFRVGRRLLWPVEVIEAFELARMEGSTELVGDSPTGSPRRPAVTKSYVDWFKERSA